MVEQATLRWVVRIPMGAPLPPEIVEHIRAWTPDRYDPDAHDVVVTFAPDVRWDTHGNIARIRAILDTVPPEWVSVLKVIGAPVLRFNVPELSVVLLDVVKLVPGANSTVEPFTVVFVTL